MVCTGIGCWTIDVVREWNVALGRILCERCSTPTKSKIVRAPGAALPLPNFAARSLKLYRRCLLQRPLLPCPVTLRAVLPLEHRMASFACKAHGCTT